MTAIDFPVESCNDWVAVRSGIRVAGKGEKPREFLGVVTSSNRSKSFAGYLMLRFRQKPPPPKHFRGFLRSGQPSRRTKSWGRKVPARHESLNCWPPFDSRGDQNRVSGHVGLESAYQGWHPMRTVAQQQGNKNQRSAAWGVPKAVIRRALPKIGEML